MELAYGPQDAAAGELTTQAMPLREDQNFTSLAEITELEPLTAYRYEVIVDDSKAGEGSFTTAPLPYRPAEFSYFLASCISFKVSYDQPAWDAVLQQNYDFQMFHGDNVYSDNTDYDVLWGDHITQRSIENFAEVLATAPTYATWDDHDYGPNNSDGSASGKENSLRAFRDLWANPSYGLPEVPGVFYTYMWGDVQFFVLDNRYHRTDPGSGADRTQLGQEQRAWLLDGLKQSRAPFKIIISGGSVQRGGEKWAEYEVEFTTIMNFIRDNKIYGVMFQAGDVHIVNFMKYDDEAQDEFGSNVRPALLPYETEMGYPVYEIISSGIAKHDKRPWSIINVNTALADPALTARFYEQETFKEEHILKLSDLTHDGFVNFIPHTPGAGDTLTAGTEQTIAWTNVGTAGTVNLEYSTGVEWKSIASAVANTGSFEWTVPADPSATVKVRVSDATGDASGESRGFFEITDPQTFIASQADQQRVEFHLVGQNSRYLAAPIRAKTAFIYDLQGRLVTELPLRQGLISWDGRDRRGRDVVHGLYVLRLGPGHIGGAAHSFMKF